MKSALLGAGLALAMMAMPAQAVVIDFTNANGSMAAGSDAHRNFQIAGRYWSSILTNDVTLRIDIGFGKLRSIASTGSSRASIGNTAFYAALAGSAASTLDASAVATLRPLSGAGALVVQTNALNEDRTFYLDDATRIDDDGSANNRGLSVNTALTRALGITNNVRGERIDYSGLDGTIVFSDARRYDYDASDGIDDGAMDFLATAIHEIGHALGFRSGVNSYDEFTAPGGSRTGAGGLENFINIATPLDLFRYTAAGVLDWSTQGVPYFSIDGGVSQLFGESRFATGVFNGDGEQASHWIDLDPEIGLMDPTSARGQMGVVTALDVAAFDAMGWTLGFDPLANAGYRVTTADIYRNLAAVPELGTWAMMLTGMGIMGGALRRKRHPAPRVAHA